MTAIYVVILVEDIERPRRVLVVNSARNSGAFLGVSLQRQETYSSVQYFSEILADRES